MTEVSSKLLATVQKLSDLEDIRALRNLYHHFINERCYARFGEIYAADAVVHLEHFPKWEGVAQILEGYAKIPSLGFVLQFPHNHHIDLRGDEAEGFAYYEASIGGGNGNFLVGGRYDEKYRRTREGWRISYTRAILLFAAPVAELWTGDALSGSSLKKIADLR